MRRIKAKPLAFLIGIVTLGVSVFGFMVTSPERDERAILYGLSSVGIVIGAILLAYGLLPHIRAGGEGELGETTRALAHGLLWPLRVLLKLHPIPRFLVIFLVGAGLAAGGYYSYQHMQGPLQLGTANIASGKGDRYGFVELKGCTVSAFRTNRSRILGYTNTVANSVLVYPGTRVTIEYRALQCSPPWYKVQLPDGRLLWFTEDDLRQ